MNPRHTEWPYWFGLGLIWLLGSWLRLYLLGGQILLDDEWHGLDFSVENNVPYLLSHFAVPGATSMPLNVYQHLLLVTVGWSEDLLRLPAVVPGMLVPIVLPLLLRRTLGRPVTIVFAALLAVSPFLIFYSRVARPYGMTVLLACTALVLGYRWLASAGGRLPLGYLLAAAAAVYLHPFALLGVATPLLCAAGLSLIHARGWRWAPTVKPSWTGIAGAAVALALLLAPLAVASVQSFRAGLLRGLRSGLLFDAPLTAGTLWDFSAMLSGTSDPLLVVVFVLLAGWGMVVLARGCPLLAWVVAGAFFAYALGLGALRPYGTHAAIVLARYAIPLFPMACLLVAVGATAIATRIAGTTRFRLSSYSGAIGALPALVLLVSLVARGPLPATYGSPNAFTNHSAFQDSYEPFDWSESRISSLYPDEEALIRRSEIPSFYQDLAADASAGAIIEYPMMLGDYDNPLYYYQHFHRKRVIAGYVYDPTLRQQPSKGFISSSTYIDEVLSRVKEPTRLRFANLVDLSDLAAAERSDASYLVVHLEHPEPEVMGPLVDRVRRLSGERWGHPVFEDSSIVVYALRAGQLPATVSLRSDRWLPGRLRSRRPAHREGTGPEAG